MAEEDYSLILAGAGTGKTTTITAKVKYLVDIKKIPPEKILIISYTKKATEELIKRINIDFNIPAKISTFHSIGYEYIRKYFNNKKCYIVDENIKNQIFFEYFKKYLFEDKEKLKDFIYLFGTDYVNKEWTFGEFLKNNYDKYDTYDIYFKYYKEYAISNVTNLKHKIESILEHNYNQEHIYTIKNELVKSKGEAIIADYLFTHNIPYKYEKIYKNLVDDNRIYKPDFTLDLYGEEVYIEYFGLSTYESKEINIYNKIREKKIKYNLKHKNKFIYIDYMPGEDIINTLENSLAKFGIKINKKSDIEIYDEILNKNPLSQIYPIKDLFYEVISSIKSSPYRKEYKKIVLEHINNLDNNNKLIYEKQFKYICDFYKYYQDKLFEVNNLYGIDFDDMLFYFKECIKHMNSDELNFKYLIIDEYQDISFEKYSIAKNIVDKNNSKVFAVGDDWQTIFSYNGSKISYIYNFEKYFKGCKKINITKTYRNSQELINYSGEFIMKNESQIKKQLISNKNLKNPIIFKFFENFDEIITLKELIKQINKTNPTHKILILARTKKSIKEIFNDKDFIDDIDTKVKLVNYDDLTIDAMTIHKSKGLTADEVIIIGLNQYFPSDNYPKFWLIDLFCNKPLKESIDFAEERRVFYVALTRTKNHVYLLVNKNPKYRSKFINEIYNIIK